MLSRAAWADGREHFRRSPIFQLWRAVQDQLEELQGHIVGAFAAERGWHRARRVFTFAQLSAGRPARAFPNDYAERTAGASSVLDHPDFFRQQTAPCRPVALVTHLYGHRYDACFAFADQHGLSFTPLPWSWYYPGGCIAGVFTRDPSNSPTPRARRRPRLYQVERSAQ
jgi:hypothetical protein